jgi:hypothetical protein
MNPLIFLAQTPSPTPTPIRDIAAPIYVLPWPMWVVYTAAGAVLVILALVVWLIVYWWRNRPAPVPPTLREIAMAELEKARGQMRGTDPYEFSILVSDILRRYVSAQFSLRATQQTSPEFLASIAELARFAGTEKELLANFLEKCDLIKFARIGATAEDSAALLEQAFLFVKGGGVAHELAS